MFELELTRAREDRRTYRLEGIGSLRRTALFSSATIATSESGDTWELRQRGLTGRRADAVAGDGTTAGEFDTERFVDHGGTLTWRGAAFSVRSTRSWATQYTLADGDRDLLVVDVRGWGKRPATVRLADLSIDPGLVLYFTWLVQTFNASDSSAAATAAAT